MGTWPERWPPPEMTSLWWWWSVERGRTGTAGGSAAKCEGIGWRETGEGMEWEKGSVIGEDRRGLGFEFLDDDDDDGKVIWRQNKFELGGKHRNH